jgi:hypothetical protein
MKCLFNKSSSVLYYAAPLLLGCVLAAGADPSAGSGALSGKIVWSDVTNKFCAGVAWFSTDHGKGVIQVARILLKTTQTNAGWGYFMPPEGKLAKAELRDAQGVLVVPLLGKKLEGQLPHQTLLKDWPREPARGFHNPGGAPTGGLSFPADNLPVRFSDFSMQDIYRVESEGDYTFTVFVALYHFIDDQQSLVRIDLPSVTVHMHLTPSPN